MKSKEFLLGASHGLNVIKKSLRYYKKQIKNNASKEELDLIDFINTDLIKSIEDRVAKELAELFITFCTKPAVPESSRP